MKALRVLVVEDDALIGMLLAEILAGMGHDVCAIEATEADAVAAAIRLRPHLMIVDVRLREGSGVSAVKEILRTRPVPHVFVSGDFSAVRALMPAAVVIQKPFRELDLARAMQFALGAGTASRGAKPPFPTTASRDSRLIHNDRDVSDESSRLSGAGEESPGRAPETGNHDAHGRDRQDN